MLAALESCADLFVKFGGHRQAAGLTMERGKVKEFRKRINEWADARLEPDDLIPRLRVDGELEFNDITVGRGGGHRRAPAVRPRESAAGVRRGARWKSSTGRTASKTVI